ncbi:MAG: alpha/beta hydrolase [Bdellovibrionales bacterium]|nr:alpha/beta hydrolase [Bdellovibrionales bacterium]
MSVLENFHYQVVGDECSHKLVFLHGLMGSLSNWRKIINSFKDDHQVLIYDQRGHGRSQHPRLGYQPEDFARDLKEILDELRWEKIQLVGHSMGGRNALVFADLFPRRITHLVLEDISPEADEKAVQRIEFLLGLVPIPFANKAEAKKFFEVEFPSKLKGVESAQVLSNYFYTNIELKPDGTAGWRFSLPGILESLRSGRERDRWQELKNLQMPTLLVRGGESKDLTSAVFEKMLSCNPHIQGVEIPHAGHWVHFDQSEAFVKALKDFLGG